MRGGGGETHLDVATCLKGGEHEHEAEAQDDDVHQLLPLGTHPAQRVLAP